MRPLAPLLLPLLPFTTAFPQPQPAPTTNRIPTSYESAVLGRRILALTPLATISTVFPSNASDPRQPPAVAGLPHNILSYVADCDPASDSGHPTILALSIETTYHNVAAGSNVSLAVSWTPPFAPARRISLLSRARTLFSAADKHQQHVAAPSAYSAANLPRFSLTGYVERIAGGDGGDARLAACYLRAHPDARYWLPGNRIHEAHFVRLVVQAVYWVGGFGDRAYIGWIPVEEWEAVTRAEWEAVRLPGEEKGWKEWSVEGAGDL